MNILMLAPDYRLRSAWGCELFRDEIGRQCDSVVRYYGTEDNLHVPDILEKHPDVDLVLMMQLQFGRHYTGIRDVELPTVCWVEDYFPRHHDIKNQWLRWHEFDLVFLTQQYFLPVFDEFQVNGVIPGNTERAWLPFSVDTKTYFETPFKEKETDVVALFNAHAFEYPNRAAVVDELNDMLGVKVLAKLANRPSDGVYHRSYVRALENAKIGVASLDQHGSCNQRHYEIPACGTLLLTDGPPRDFPALQFREGEHYVLYDGISDLHDKVRYYLEHDDERLTIAQNGHTLVTGRHSNTNRARDMFKIIAECFNGRT